MLLTIMRSICVAAAMVPVTAVAQDQLRFDRLFVIGDSLSDGGAYSQAGAAGVLPAIRYRFTTNAADGSSRTYAEALATPATASTNMDCAVGRTN